MKRQWIALAGSICLANILLTSLSAHAVAQNQRTFFAEVSNEEYQNYFLKNLFGLNRIDSPLLKPEHSTVVRVDDLLSKLDSSARTSVNPHWAALPRVRSVIFDDKEFIAFQAATPRCLEIPVQWSPEPSRIDGLKYVALDPNQGISVQNVPSSCLPQKASPKVLQELVSWINDKFFDRTRTSCRLQFQAPFDRVVLSEDCDSLGLASIGLSGVSSFQFPVVMNVISLSTHALETLSEEPLLAAVLAHELAHYYLHHTLIPLHGGYFYDLTKEQPGQKPQREEDLSLIGALAREASGSNNLTNRSREQRYREELYYIIDSTLQATCNSKKPKCEVSCESLAPRLREIIQNQSQKFESVDQAIGQCARTVSIFERSEKRSIPNLTLNEITSMFDSSSRDEFWRLCMGKLPATSNLDELLTEMNKRMNEPMCSKKYVLDRAAELKLGYYTSEQEADVFALKILKAAGYDPSALRDVMLRFAEIEGDPKCDKWESQQVGNPVPLIKDYSDTHHETCFRAHYIKRVLEAGH